MPFPLLVPPVAGDGGGIAEYDTWDDLPDDPEDGDLAALLDADIICVAQDGHWLPAPLVGSRTLTRDGLSFGLDESSSDLTAAGWTVTGATKTAGSPLVINGTSTASMIQAVAPARYLLRLEVDVSAGQGWLLVADNGPTRRADFQYTATEIRRANSSSTTTRGPYTSTGPLFVLFDWTGATPVVAWWTPGALRLTISDFEPQAPSALEALSSAPYDDRITVLGSYPGNSATYDVVALDIWEVS